MGAVNVNSQGDNSLRLPFSQVDVFGSSAHRGNPVAVVHAADRLPDELMAAFARWTNLSETTFLLAPTQPEADYRLRIFTPGGELPFAGHPTLGSCHAWLQAGGRTRDGDTVVQECETGLVSVRRLGDQLAFAAPPLRRSGPLAQPFLERLVAAIRVPESAVKAHQWVDNGPGWCALLLDSAERVLGVEPDLTALRDVALGLIGPQGPGSHSDYEVRAFVPGLGVPEDPVTGSLNAGIAQWLMGARLAPGRYVVRQGTRLRRSGRLILQRHGGDIWVAGSTRTLISGEASFTA